MEPHPIYNAYEANQYGVIFVRDGKSYHLVTRCGACPSRAGTVFVQSKNGKQFAKMPWEKFVWECFNGLVPKGFMVVHKNGEDGKNNSLSNLQLCPTVSLHPIYDDYEAYEFGGIFFCGDEGHNGHFLPENKFGTVCLLFRNRIVCMTRGKFVWECFNGLVPKGFMVVHINGDVNDNSLRNLKLCPKKGSEVVATKNDVSTKYESMYDASKATGVNRGLIKKICDGKVEHTKCGYKFRYA